MLEKEHLSSICLKDKVLLYLFFFFPTKWRIREHDIISIFILYISDIGREGIHFTDVGIMDSMQYHIHHPEDICEWRFLIPEEGIFSEEFELFIRLHLRADMIIRFDEKSTTPSRRIIDGLSYFRIDDIDDELDDRARSIELSTITPVVPIPWRRSS